MYYKDSPYGQPTYPAAPINSTPLTEMYTPPPNYSFSFSPDYLKNPWVIVSIILVILLIIWLIYHYSKKKE
jgi:hypothetical protein